MARHMGARVQLDLTSEVTHLIARAPGSEKYTWALRFHMQVVRPEWLYQVREAWLSGEDHVDADALAAANRLGALEGMRIALSGVDDMAQREALAEMIAAQGGSLAPRLVLDGSLTHLVCARSTQREQRSLARVLDQKALAQRFDLAQLPASVPAACAIKAVHIEWLEDVGEAGVLLPEAEYDVQREVPTREARAARVAELRPRAPPPRRAPSPPSASAPPPAENAPLSRLVERIHSESATAGRGSPAPSQSGLLAMSRASRFGREAADGVFAGRRVYVDMHDDVRTQRVAGAVRAAGGSVQTDAAGAHFAVGPLWAPARGAARSGAALATHHWVERCLHYEALLDVYDGPASQPAQVALPLRDAQAVCMSFTGVDRDGPEYHHCLAAIDALGMRYMDAFSRAHTTHLLCGSDAARDGIKCRKAHEWGVPVVGYAFLAHALRTGRLGGEASTAGAAGAVESGAVDTGAAESGAAESEPGGPARVSSAPGAPGAPGGKEAATSAAWEPSPPPAAGAESGSAAPASPRRAARRRSRHDARSRRSRLTSEPPLRERGWDTWDEPAPPEDGAHVSLVVYDDPAARKEHTRLMALVGDDVRAGGKENGEEQTAKRRRH